MRQARFLLLPWVRVKCLASKALGLGLRQLADDWQQAHGLVGPVPVETYVDRQRRTGTYYQASNWPYLGLAQTRGAWGGVPLLVALDQVPNQLLRDLFDGCASFVRFQHIPTHKVHLTHSPHLSSPSKSAKTSEPSH